MLIVIGKRKKKKSKLKKVIIISAIALAVILLSISAVILNFLYRRPFEKELFIQIPDEANTKRIVKIFNKYNGLKPTELSIPLIRMIVFVTGNFPKSGTYRFSQANSNLDIIRALFTGRQRSIVFVTFPEGIRLVDFASIVQKKLGVDSSEFIAEAQNSELIEKLNIPIKSLEGYLMPESYHFFYKTSTNEIIVRLVNEQNKVWAQKFEKQAKEKGLSRHFVLTLASIIEAESPLKEERKRISGVFYNRLAKGMNLESDPTVQYALGTKQRLRYSDLQIDNPYNTYLYKGLPPGPINSPSIESIEAALNPEKHKFLYFVSYGDGSGRHYFSETYEKHLANRLKFKMTRKKNDQNLKKQ